MLDRGLLSIVSLLKGVGVTMIMWAEVEEARSARAIARTHFEAMYIVCKLFEGLSQICLVLMRLL